MAFLRGDNRILSIKISGVWVPLACLTGNSFSETVDMIPTTTRANAGWASSIAGQQSYTISFTAIQKKTDTGFISYDELKQIERLRQRIEWKLESVVDSLIDIGEGYLTGITEQADAGANMSFDGEIQGYGEPVTYTDTTAPTAPYLNPITDYDEDHVTLTWTSSTDDVGVVSYQIWRDGALYDTVASDFLTYTDYGVAWAAVYSYNVKAVDGAGNEGPLSNKRIITIPIPPGGDPNDFLLFADGSNILTADNKALIQA